MMKGFVIVLTLLHGALAQCPSGYWGRDCSYQCHCANPAEQCSRTTGTCTSGCAAGWSRDECSLGNIAFKKTANQSSTYANWHASLAVDGSSGNVVLNNECAHTNFDYQPYIVIDLGRPHVVYSISLLNRRNYGGRLSSVQTRVGNYNSATQLQNNALCGYLAGTVGDGEDYKFTCQDWMGNKLVLVGRYVTVQITGRETYLTVCEVKVHGYAMGGECPSSKTGPSCQWNCHCRDQEENKVCDSVGGRCPSGCYPGWMGPDCQTPCPSGYWGINCAAQCHCANEGEVCDPVTGSFCGIDLTCKTGWGGPGCQEGNIAYRKVCRQSSTAFAGTCEKAVDGVTQQYYWRGSCSHTTSEYEPWFKMNLGYIASVASVTIVNRQSWSKPVAERLAGFEVRVGNDGSNNMRLNSLCNSYVTAVKNAEIVMITCSQKLQGQYVSVQIYGRTEYLTMCEVVVSGYVYAKECTSGNWGPMCGYQCGKCRYGATCDPITGNCPSGCDSGYQGSDCTKKVACPSGWFQLDGLESSCYKYLTSLNTQSENMKLCQNEGGRLVAIETKEENDAIYSYLKNRGDAGDLITSGFCPITSEGKHGTCQWLSTQQVFRVDQWAPGEPRYNGPVIQLWKVNAYQWDDVDEFYLGQALCEL